MERLFPDTFGGLTNSPQGDVVVYAVSDASALERYITPRVAREYGVRMEPSPRSLREIHALKDEIQSAKPSLAAEGIHVTGLGIRITGGPRVFVLVADAGSIPKLERRYGADRLLFLVSGGVVNQ